jgi:iron complex transport system ATP-binding protein
MQIRVKDATVLVKRKSLLEGINVELQAGEVLVAIGPNGAGKSTLLKVISGEVEVDHGYASLNESPISSYSLKVLSGMMAVLPQQTELHFPFEVRQVIALGRIPHASGNKRNTKIVDEVMELLEIEHLAHRDYTTLSGGEMQRVQFARALCQVWDISCPGFLLLDEPTSSLDLSHQHAVLKVAKGMSRQGIGVFVVLHDMNLAARYADRIVLMNSGGIVQQGSPDEVLSEQNLQGVFGVNIRVLKHPEGDHPLVISW